MFTSKDQDLVSDVAANCVPLLNIDIWEHAYYLDYKNARPQFLGQIWKIVNWKRVEDRLQAALIETKKEREAAKAAK